MIFGVLEKSQLTESESNVRKFLSILVLFVVFTGCYTVMRHQKVDREESYLSSEISHRDVCSSCHLESGQFTLEDPYALQLPYRSPRLKNWNAYYHYPWWADEFYYRDGPNREGGNTLPIDPRSFGNRKGVDGSIAPALSAPAGPGQQFRKKAIGQDSTQAVEKAPPKKPTTDREKLKESKKRTKKKKND